jgi:hypothetical protein
MNADEVRGSSLLKFKGISNIINVKQYARVEIGTQSDPTSSKKTNFIEKSVIANLNIKYNFPYSFYDIS